MPDHFEQAKDDILFRTKGNGGPTTRDLLIAMGALAKDMDESIAASCKAAEERHEESARAMKEHIKYADLRDKRIAALEAQSARYETECPQRLEAIIEEAVERSEAKHEVRHNAYVASVTQKRRDGDKAGEDHRSEREESRQVWLMWMVGSKVSYIIVAVLTAIIVMVVSQLAFGSP